MLSPQRGTQALFATGHTQPGVTVQLEQPSVLTALPSSHCSLGVRMPSPHTSCVHLEGPSPAHDQLGSTAQPVQPSLPTPLPSSQASPAFTTPSPQRGFWKQNPGKGQDQPFSTVQPAEQPLPTAGGSQPSAASITELPQVAPVPTSGEKLAQPGKQPSTPGGSQISPGSRVPLPHTIDDMHTLGSPEHIVNGSTLHAAEHPSPLTRAPSSHASPPRIKPSPQIGAQAVAEQ
jgi:hypothetical protein